ncbi:MAG: hypothetical protein AAFV53_19345, partial [Myxococcota bacterium]
MLGATGQGIAMNVTVEDAVFDGNVATNSGGAIYVSQGDLSLSDATFTGNEARQGGALLGSLIEIRDAAFRDNTSTAGGGAIAQTGLSTLTIRDSEILRNGDGLGGAVLTWGAPVSLVNVDLGTGADENRLDDINANSNLYSWDGSGVVTVDCDGQANCQ